MTVLNKFYQFLDRTIRCGLIFIACVVWASSGLKDGADTLSVVFDFAGALSLVIYFGKFAWEGPQCLTYG